MKYLTVSIIIITCLMLVINTAFADVFPPECWGPNPPRYCKYGDYKGPLYLTFAWYHPELVFLVNFSFLLISTIISSYFFLNYKNIKKILLGTLLATIGGAIIDTISLNVSLIIHDIVMSTGLLEEIYELKIIYYASVFLISFLLLKLMYSIIFNKLYKVGPNKKVKLVTIILAIITNPAWFLLLSSVVDPNFLYNI